MDSYARDWDTLTSRYAKYIRFERNLSDNTAEGYLGDVAKFREFIGREYGILAHEVEARHIEAFMADIYDHRLKASTQARMLSGLKSFYDFLLVSDVIEKTPAEFIDAPRTGRKLPDVLSVAEIDAIISSIDLSHPQGHRNKAMLETLYSCGLRVSELTGLRLGDLFFNDGFIRVVGKGDKQRLVPVSDTARHNIELWLRQRSEMTVDPKSADIVFLNRRGRKLTREMIFTIVRNATRQAGIEKEVSPHSFRHSFATHLIQGGAGIRQVQEMLGHESILTTEVYTHLDRTHLRKTMEEHHPLGDDTLSTTDL